MSERMQALLSRAAEDQLTEQRQVSAVLTDLRQLVTGLGERLDETASGAQLQSLGQGVSEISNELRGATSGLAHRLDALGQRVEPTGRRVGDYSTSQSHRSTGYVRQRTTSRERCL